MTVRDVGLSRSCLCRAYSASSSNPPDSQWPWADRAPFNTSVTSASHDRNTRHLAFGRSIRPKYKHHQSIPMLHTKSKWLALLSLALATTGVALAQSADSQALIDALIKKGVL